MCQGPLHLGLGGAGHQPGHHGGERQLERAQHPGALPYPVSGGRSAVLDPGPPPHLPLPEPPLTLDKLLDSLRDIPVDVDPMFAADSQK